MSPRSALAALCVAAAVAGFSAYRYWDTSLAAPSAAPTDLQFTGLDGTAHRLSDWRGKLLLVNFWATWCAPCLKEIPLLIEAQKTYGPRGLQILGPAMDTAEPVRRFAERLGVNYPIMIGEANVAANMDALGDTLGALPFSVLIDREGRVLDRFHGDFSREELEALIAKHL